MHNYLATDAYKYCIGDIITQFPGSSTARLYALRHFGEDRVLVDVSGNTGSFIYNFGLYNLKLYLIPLNEWSKNDQSR